MFQSFQFPVFPVRILDRIIVLRLLSLELQMTCSYHPIVVVSLYKCYWILVLCLTLSTTTFFWIENYVGIRGSALAWFKLYLSDRHQFVAVNEEVPYQSQVQYGVPQGSVLGPLILTLYMLPLGDIIRKHGVSFHCCADDTQLYISFRPDETYQFAKITECIFDIKNWMTSHFLQLKSEKTEVLIIGPKTSACNNLEHCLILDGCSVNS